MLQGGKNEIKADDAVQNSPCGRPYLLSRPAGLEGVTQSMVTSFLRHWSMSTALKKATDWGRSCMPNAWANTLLQETQAENLFIACSIEDILTGKNRY